MVLDQILEKWMISMCEKLVQKNTENVEGGMSMICDDLVDERTVEIVKESLSEHKLEENLKDDCE